MSVRIFSCLLILPLLASLLAAGAEAPQSPPLGDQASEADGTTTKQAPQMAGPAQLQEIAGMAMNHVADAEIIAKVRSDGFVYQLTAEDIEYLKEYGVSDPVIIAVNETGRAGRDGNASEAQKTEPSSDAEASSAPASGHKRVPVTVCEMVTCTVIKKVPYTVTRIGADGKPVTETCYKDVPETVCKPVYKTTYVEVAVSGDAIPAKEEPQTNDASPAHSKALDEALARLRLYPRDAYLQFVVMQLARREHCLADVASEVAKLIGDSEQEDREARRESVDLFSIFTGALAVQESLQLDTMRGHKELPTDGSTEKTPTPVPTPAVDEPAPDESDELRDLERKVTQPGDDLLPSSEPSRTGATPETAPAPVRLPFFSVEGIGDTVDQEPAPSSDAELLPAPTVVIESNPAAEETAPTPTPVPPPDSSFATERKKEYPPVVDVAELNGPEIKSHPWKEMLAGRTPEIEPLAKMVPADFYYVHFKKLSRLLDVAQLVNHLATHFGNQASHDARTQATAERLKKQLCLPINNKLPAGFDDVIEEVAVLGSDPFIHEGSDVTLLIRYNMVGFLAEHFSEGFPLRCYPDCPYEISAGCEYGGVAYEHIETVDKLTCLYVAYLPCRTVIRTNSLVALKRIIDTINGHTPDGQSVTRLGDTDEFAYIRTLYPVRAEEEDGLVYLSDPFIRHLVSPQLKLTERRRMVCYNHLRMIGHAAMLFRSEHGRPPQSLDELYQAGCLPCPFHGEPSEAIKAQVADLLDELATNGSESPDFACAELKKLGPVCKELLRAKLNGDMPLEVAMSIETVLADMEDEPTCCCPDEGCYHLSADGMSGVCDHHGHSHFLTPCLEHPVEKVFAAEARQYDDFRQDYDKYWRTYFDPIAIRIQATPERYRLETIVLPLIDNSIYKGLSYMLGGQPTNLDAGPVPNRNIFSLALRLNKEEWIKQLAEAEKADSDDESETSEDEAAEEETPASTTPAPQPKKDGLNGVVAGLIEELGLSSKDIDLEKLDVEKFLTQGIGNQIGLHIYDAPPNFDFNFSSAMGMLLQLLGGHQTSSHSAEFVEAFADMSEFFALGGLLAAFNGPVYLSIPVENAEIVDAFGDELERVFAVLSRQATASYRGLAGAEFYRVPFKDNPQRFIRALAVQVGPVKFRGFWGRIGNTVYIASQPCVLNDLLAMEHQKQEPAAAEAPEVAHAMFKIRAHNWNEVLENTYLGWAENHRAACIENQGPLSNVAAAYTASLGKIDEAERATVAERIMREAERLHGVRFICPEGGHYVLSPDGKQMTCSVHGSAMEPRQPADLNTDGTIGQYLKQFGGLTASLSFLEDGLRAVLVIERK